MIFDLSYKTKQFFFVLIKLSIVIGSAYFIYKKLALNAILDFTDFVDFIVKNDAFSTKNIVFLLFLSILNWFFEILKWQNIVSFVTYISFYEALKQSLSSLTASLFTPNRIGDYGAKAIFFKKSQRKKILLLNLISNLAQLSTTLVFGIIGLSILITEFNIGLSYFKLFLTLSAATLLGVLFITIIASKKFNIKGFSVPRIKLFITGIPTEVHLKNYFFSIMRYFLFSFQFYVLLRVFGTDLDYFNAMVAITSLYLLTSIIPTIFIFDVVVKGSVALYIFSFFDTNDLIVLSIITLMWILNFVLPSIFGCFYVLNFNYYRHLDNLQTTNNTP